MSEISLKEYFAKLNSLLSINSADEVIHHCRHILQYFPKNVTAYRFLGRALVMNGRWEEGREALRRVLSVIPDDYFAHLGLSEANERMNRPDEAIWHLERAFEQRPNDKDLIDALRGLYRQYRHVDNLKVQLTSASVARQYLRSGAYTQAIDSLRTALTRMSERLDLKLLLAQILWQNGSQEEAAEIALEVLKVLPDCLEANKIMAQLWLSVDRPSDAQRFVNHLEGVDPYLAVELVQGYPPEDDVFQIEELDYVRSAQSELASARPDWLSEISSGPSAQAEPIQSGSAPPKVDEPEWTNWASAMLNKSAPQTDKLSSANVPTSERFAAMKKDEEAIRTGGLTDLFGKVDEANSDELSALFEAGEAEDEDPMAWLRESGVELVEDEEDSQPTFDNLFADDVDNSPLPQQDEDPMAWLQNSNDDLILDHGNNADSALEQDGDSMAWLRDSAPGEFDDAQPETAANDDNSLDWLSDDHALDEALGLESLADGNSQAEPQEWDQAAFARDEQEEAVPAPVEQEIPGARRGLTAMLQDTSFDWSKNEQEDAVTDDAEMDDWLKQFGPSEPNKAQSVTDTPDWLTSLDEAETESTEKDEWFAPDEAEPIAEFEIGSAETSASSSGEDSDWLAEFAPETDTPDDEFAWSTASPAAEPEAQSSDVPDWLSSVDSDADAQPENADASSNDEFAWMSDGEPSSEPEAEAEDAPDWLTALAPESDNQETEPEATSAVGSDDEFAWMSEDALSQTETEAESSVAEETPDWLSALAPEADNQETEPEATSVSGADDEFAWMSEDALSQAETEAESATAEETPDWLTALAPEADNQEAEPEATSVSGADDEFAWMSEDALSQTETEAESASAEATPDWLSALNPTESDEETEPEAVNAAGSDEEFAWMSEDALSQAETEAESSVAEETPDWLSALAPEADNQETEPEAASAVGSDEEFAWMSEDALSQTETEAESAVAEETPDWLSALAPEADNQEAEPEAVNAAGSDEEFAWMSEDALSQAETEAESSVAEETPDWLSALAPEASESEAEPTAEVTPESEYMWMTDDAEPQAEAEPVAAAEESPDWLSELKPEQTDEQATPESESAAVSDLSADPEFSWMSEDSLSKRETESEPEPMAEESGDWLSELEPTSDDQEAETAAGDSVPDWLAEAAPEQGELEPAHDITANDTILDPEFGWKHDADEQMPEPVAEAQTPEPAAEPEREPVSVEEEPEPITEAVAAESGDPVFDEANGISDNEAESGDEHEEALETSPAQNAPDWLNAMVPGLDVDYEVEQDEPEPEQEEEPVADKREFAWVAEMVDQEVAASERPTYIFSNPPGWLAPTNSQAGNGKADDDLPDWPSDDADADVPEWLR